jgi:hypothetical protein
MELIYLHFDSLIENERDVIIWDVLIAIISRNILRNCFIRQQIRDRIFGNFTYFSGRT